MLKWFKSKSVDFQLRTYCFLIAMFLVLVTIVIYNVAIMTAEKKQKVEVVEATVFTPIVIKKFRDSDIRQNTGEDFFFEEVGLELPETYIVVVYPGTRYVKYFQRNGHDAVVVVSHEIWDLIEVGDEWQEEWLLNVPKSSYLEIYDRKTGELIEVDEEGSKNEED